MKKKGIKETVNEVYFERVFNLGNYETMRIGLRATVTESNGVEETLKALDKATVRYKKARDA